MSIEKVFIVECEEVKSRIKGSFTFGKIYTLHGSQLKTYYNIVDDNGVLCKNVSYVYFVSIKEWREYRLTNLGIN
jgi:hypothetical protein